MSDTAQIATSPGAKPEFEFGTPVSELYGDPAGYDPDEELRAAIQVAMLLGMPLLLTGDPGCGKTSVAHWLAWKLGLGASLTFNVKSTSVGRDLLYNYDELARFRDAQHKESKPPSEYLTLNALGQAILFSANPTKLLAPGRLLPRDIFRKRASADPAAEVGTELDARFGKRHVVLIDEIDKAPRDTPNDLLLEIDQVRFRIPELDIEVVGDPALRPVVVITSNTEKSLPEPFLRRCVFHHIPAPDDVRRREIVKLRKHPFVEQGQLFDDAMRFFQDLSPQLSRRPGNAELLAWLTDLDVRVKRSTERNKQVPKNLAGLMKPSLGVLAKTRDDLDTARRALASAKFG